MPGNGGILPAGWGGRKGPSNLYIFTSQRPESYVIPTEADGGGALWNEIFDRGLFDPELTIQAATSDSGLFCWPPRR